MKHLLILLPLLAGLAAAHPALAQSALAPSAGAHYGYQRQYCPCC